MINGYERLIVLAGRIRPPRSTTVPESSSLSGNTDAPRKSSVSSAWGSTSMVSNSLCFDVGEQCSIARIDCSHRTARGGVGPSRTGAGHGAIPSRSHLMTSIRPTASSRALSAAIGSRPVVPSAGVSGVASGRVGMVTPGRAIGYITSPAIPPEPMYQ